MPLFLHIPHIRVAVDGKHVVDAHLGQLGDVGIKIGQGSSPVMNLMLISVM